MKKILLATAVLAFAGSAFAATVSGSVTTKYYTNKDGDSTKSFATSGDVKFSGSKTSSSGLTFGGTYTVKVGNANTTADAHAPTTVVATPGTTTATVPVTVITTRTGQVAGTATVPVTGRYTNVASTTGKFVEGTQTKSEVTAFVSGSFGKVTVGHHDSIAEQFGGKGTENLTNAVTYTSPTFTGFSAGYTFGATAKDTRGFGIKYAGEFSGVSLGFGYGNESKTTDDEKVKTTSWKLSASMSGITAEYKNSTVKGEKATGWSLKYAASNWDVKYGIDTKADKTKVNKLVANYTVADGLKLMVEDKKDGTKKTTYIGTKISF